MVVHLLVNLSLELELNHGEHGEHGEELMVCASRIFVPSYLLPFFIAVLPVLPVLPVVFP